MILASVSGWEVVNGEEQLRKDWRDDESDLFLHKFVVQAVEIPQSKVAFSFGWWQENPMFVIDSFFVWKNLPSFMVGQVVCDISYTIMMSKKKS